MFAKCTPACTHTHTHNYNTNIPTNTHMSQLADSKEGGDMNGRAMHGVHGEYKGQCQTASCVTVGRVLRQ